MNPLQLTFVSATLVLSLSSASVLAQGAPMTAKERDGAVRSIADAIARQYYDEERAAEIAAGLIKAIDEGEYAAIDDADALASALTARLSEVDRHFRVNYVGMEAIREIEEKMKARMAGGDHNHSEHDDPYAGLRRANFGFAGVEILPGNIGYIDLRQFAPIEPALQTATAALEFIANTDAVIFDVRNNGGGEPSMVQFLISHFLPPGGETLINTFVSRDTEYPVQLWSLPSHPAGNRPDTPLYVLISGATGSAGEAFPYHLRALERATLIGETTYGAGNPGDTFYLEEGYSIFISTGSARNPITGTNWEGIGVEPHVAVDASTALDEALMRIYAGLLETADDPHVVRSLTWARESLAARRDPIELSTADLARYAGDFGTRRAFVEDGHVIYVREGSPPKPLVPLGHDRFEFTDSDRYRIVFRFDGDGRLEAMDLRMIDGRVIVNPIED